MGSSSGGSNTERPIRESRRYQRSSTVSNVTQLLSESCSSLLQRLTSRVSRNNTLQDETPRCLKSNLNWDRKWEMLRKSPPRRERAPSRKSVRSRILEYKSSGNNDQETRNSTVRNETSTQRGSGAGVTDWHWEEPLTERERSPSRQRVPSSSNLVKSSTASSLLVLSEKAYPYVQVPPRQKTPYRASTSFKPLLVNINTDEDDPELSARQARRKEIQSLIQKYSKDYLEDTNGVSALTKYQQKYSAYLSRASQRAASSRASQPLSSLLSVSHSLGPLTFLTT